MEPRILIGIVAVIYFGTGISYAVKGEWSNAGVWFCYGAANIFMLLMDSKPK